ncbi:nuclear receptor corepressor 2 [Drosophila ficusphila]|uniref:nuclear receptor corepressor 2 n=1 Tax=Drosophila ficusphila TaxID=30025 RepID=UPI0007E8164E|nr:nuclear receptor corepressor 2 [Drosophila ficusphila]
MKLEELLAGKGSSSPPEDDDEDEKVDLKPQKSSSAMTDEGAENAEDAAEDAAEKEGGKKKGTRKKRSLNWEEAERGLLLEVIKSKVAFVENRSVDAKSIKAKRLAWSQITKQFNALNFRHRLLEQIQVQWRSMKNSAKREHQQKHPKADALEGMRMIEFLEEMQKDPVSSRSQTRSANSNGAVKKELLDIDEDEDMPLAALPNSTNASEDTLQTSTIAIPSPPPSTAGGDGDSQQEATPAQPAAQRRKRAKAKPSPSGAKTEASTETGEENEKGAVSPRKRRQRNLSQAQSLLSDENEDSNKVAPASSLQQFSLSAAAAVDTNSQPLDLVSSSEMEHKYKQDLFRLLKQARLAEIDYARREHEQKLRFEQMEQEVKMAYYRQEQDLKLRHMREEHDIRLRQQRREHEARLGIYALKGSGLNGSIQEQSSAKCNAKADYNNVHEVGPSTSAEGALALNAACN